MSPTPPQTQWNFLQAIVGWVLPGAGHFALGQRARGLIVGITILLLWLGGLAIGGIGVIDQRNPDSSTGGVNLWFLGQALMGPSLAVNYVRQGIDNRNGPPTPGDNNVYTPSIGRTNEQGVLFTALAGMLNLLAVLDVLFGPSSKRATPGANKG